MRRVRIIARLDIKGPNLIKGIHLEGVRVVGDPAAFAVDYYNQGVDEIIYMDAVASLYGRNSLKGIVERTAREVFVPVTVGGGIRSLEDAKALLRAGADKVAINTAAIANPQLITEVSESFGSQCMVLSIEAKRRNDGGWEAMTDNGREHTGKDVIEWAQEAVSKGAGEILLTSIDQEGTLKGFDCELTKKVSDAVNVPVIASGGYGSPVHLENILKQGHADAVAIAHMLHYKKTNIPSLKETARNNHWMIREAHS